MTNLVVHQIWVGDVLPDVESGRTAALAEAAHASKAEYKFWNLKNIEEKFGNEEIFFFFKRIFYKHPYPHLLKVAVDYYKWRILAETPEGNDALYLDVSVQLRADKIPARRMKGNEVLVGDGSTGLSFIRVHGGSSAKRIANAIEDVITDHFDLSDPEFDWQLLDNYKPYSDNDQLLIHTAKFVRTVLGDDLSRASTDLYATYTTNKMATFVRHKLSSQKSEEEMLELHSSIVAEYEKHHEPKLPTLCVLMSSAGEYDQSPIRTLNGILTSEQLRQMQRMTTFSQELHALNLRCYFVMDTALQGSSSSDTLYIRDVIGADLKGEKMFKALQWAVKNIEPDYVFLCSDDTFVHLPRLEDYCKRHRPGELAVIASMDNEGTAQVGGGILLTIAAARKLVTSNMNPGEGVAFGEFVQNVHDAAEGSHPYTIVAEPRFSYSKSAYPARKNRYITTHGVNPYDLLALREENFD